MTDEQETYDDKPLSGGGFKPRHLVLIAVLAVAITATLYYFNFYRGAPRKGVPPTAKKIVEVPEGTRAVTLFFADRQEEQLVTETRLVAIGAQFVDQVTQVMTALLLGPQHNGVSTVSAGTELLGAFYDAERGLLYLDFSSEIVAGHPGGTSAEYFTIASIVRTISENFPEVTAVQLLVEGLQVGTLAGHIDAYKPFAVADWR